MFHLIKNKKRINTIKQPARPEAKKEKKTNVRKRFVYKKINKISKFYLRNAKKKILKSWEKEKQWFLLKKR